MQSRSRLAPFSSFLGLLVAACSLASCSASDILNSAVPREGYTRHQAIAYGPHERQKLDIYVPQTNLPGSPVAVFFYGGSWQSGSRDTYLFVGQALASRGITTIIPDYRLYPEIRFPEFLKDSALAVSWARQHAPEYGANKQNLFLMGHSAGAYNAAMLALHPSFLRDEGVRPTDIRGMIGLAGPYDFLPFTDDDIIDIFSTAPGPETQPITFASSGRAPLLLLTGEADTTVLPRNSFNLAKAQQAKHSEAKVITYPAVGHYGIILALSHEFRSRGPVLDDITAFIADKTKK